MNIILAADSIKVTDWAPIAIAFVALLVSVAAWAATRAQAKIAHRTLAYSVFNRRWEIFDETMKLLVASGNSHRAEILNDALVFLQKTRDSEFMLPRELQPLVMEVYHHVIALHRSNSDMLATPVESGNLGKRVEDARALSEKTSTLIAKVPKQFKSCLDFTDV